MFVLAAKKKIRFEFGRIHSWREHFLIAPLYSLLLTCLSVFATAKPGLVYRLQRLSITVVIDLVLIKLKILKIKWKDYPMYFSMHSLMEILSRYLNHLLNREKKAARHEHGRFLY